MEAAAAADDDSDNDAEECDSDDDDDDADDGDGGGNGEKCAADDVVDDEVSVAMALLRCEEEKDGAKQVKVE